MFGAEHHREIRVRALASLRLSKQLFGTERATVQEPPTRSFSADIFDFDTIMQFVDSYPAYSAYYCNESWSKNTLSNELHV